MRLKDILIKYFWSIALTIFGIGLIAYFWKLTTVCGSQDCYWMLTSAKEFLATGKYTLYGYPTSHFMPGYSIANALFSFVFKDLFLSAKVVTALFGTLTIPLVYFLWKEIENKKVAVFAAALFAVLPLALTYRLLVMSESLFVFFSTLTLVALYKSRTNSKWLILTALSASAAALTRWEGYTLSLAVLISIGLQYRLYKIRKILNILRHNKFLIASLITLIIPPIYWLIRNKILTEKIFPLSQVAHYSTPHAGFGWFADAGAAVTLPILIISIIGFIISLRKYRTHYPLYIYSLIYSGLHMWWLVRGDRFALPLVPILLGWFAVAFFHIGNTTVNKDLIKKIYSIIIIIILVVLATYSLPRVANTLKITSESFEVYKEFGDWFNKNTPEDAKLLAGDSAVFGFYTNREVIRYDIANYYAMNIIQDNPQLQRAPHYAYLLFLRANNIHYFVPLDKMEHFYAGTKILAENFEHHKFNINNETVILEPLKIFETDSKIYLYGVDWIGTNQSTEL